MLLLVMMLGHHHHSTVHSIPTARTALCHIVAVISVSIINDIIMHK